MKTRGSSDPLGRSLASIALFVGVFVATLLIAGSAWPISTRSERPSLDTTRLEDVADGGAELGLLAYARARRPSRVRVVALPGDS